MGRARRAKKKDNNIGILLTLVSIFLIAVTFFMLFDIKSKLKKTNPSQNIVSDEIENTINKHSPESQCCFQGYVYLGLQVPLVTRNWTMKIESLSVKHQIQWTKLARNSVPSSKSRSIRHWLQVLCSCCFITYLGLLKGERAEQRRSRVKL